MLIPFGTQAYQHRSRPLSAQNLINFYLEPAPPQAKTLAAVVPTYGIRTATTIGNAYTRGGKTVNGVPYVVYGQTLYKIVNGLSAVEIGTIPGTRFVEIVGDETNLMLVTDQKGYVWDGASITQITSDQFLGAEWVEYMDGYYIVGTPDSQQFQISANRDPKTWDALDVASAEKMPDNIIGSIVSQGELALFGRESFEIWHDSGEADFPFKRADNAFGDIGALSRFGMARCDNSIFFAGSDGVIYRLNDYAPQRVSTPAIEQAIEDAPDKTCFCMTWNEGGHKFVSFSFDEKTFVYDVATQLWHQRQSYGLTRWRPLYVIRAYDEWITGDFYSNVLGVLDPDAFTEFGHVLRGSVTSPSISQDNQRVAHDRLELVFEQGVGLQTGQGYDPKIMLRYSDDGGRTWSSEKWRALGKVGVFKARAIWNRLGAARDRIYEFAISDPVRRNLILALTDIEAIGR